MNRHGFLVFLLVSCYTKYGFMQITDQFWITTAAYPAYARRYLFFIKENTIWEKKFVRIIGKTENH